MATLLETQHLQKAFGGLIAVADVSLRVAEGTIHSIIGPNGAGKTTLFNLITGKHPPTSGTVRFKDQDITTLPVHRRAHLGIGRSFQITNLFPNLTALENVRLAAQAMGRDNFRLFRRAATLDSYLRRAYEVLDLVGLRAEALQLASSLPHGGKRKLELAILLAPDPQLLLLDEPTAGLATEQVPELIAIIKQVQARGGKTIVLVEHNMNVVMNISDQITVMHQGRVLAEGTPSQVAADATVQSAYLGELYGDFGGKQ
ncbi:MAG: ABC transporter ATP-binding protein [Anaerolineae bacterium]|nr:ABC transporter ATP-binding protein [Anaerolineae bacterium]